MPDLPVRFWAAPSVSSTHSVPPRRALAARCDLPAPAWPVKMYRLPVCSSSKRWNMPSSLVIVDCDLLYSCLMFDPCFAVEYGLLVIVKYSTHVLYCKAYCF